MCQENKVLDELYRKLGEAYYNGGFEDPLPQLLPLFDQITECLNQAKTIEEVEEPVIDEPMIEEPVAEEEVIEPQVEEAKPAMKTCPKCGAEVSEQQAFCISCGANLKEPEPVKPEPAQPEPVIKEEVKRCPSCGVEVSANQKFCIKCGASLEKPVEKPTERFTFDDQPVVQEPVKPQPVEPEPQPVVSTCPSCGAIVKPGQKFCTKCGATIQANTNRNPAPQPMSNCPKCGKPLDPNDRFCTACGTKIR